MDNLPVVIKKGRGQLEPLARPGCKQRRLCPHGKLLAILDADEVIRIHSFCNTNTQCTIDSDRFKSISWVSKVAKNIGPTPGSSDSSVEQSYLIAVSLSNNVQLFEVGHNPFLTGDDEDTNDKDTVIALLPYKSLSSMSGKQISSILSKAQLGKDVQTLFILGTSDSADIVLLVNSDSVLNFNIDFSTSSKLMVSSVFTIEPNMSVFDDDLIPQYVSKLKYAHIVWPLLFTLTDDGIIISVVYSLSTATCVCAINPVEYCKLFYTHGQDSDKVLQHISSSSFTNLSVSPDLMKMAVFTSTHYTILVHLPNYFKHFPNHYPKLHPTKSPHRSSLMKSTLQASKVAAEEEEDILKYSGLTKRQKALGAIHKGPYVGHYFTHKTRAVLKDKVGGVNLPLCQGLDLGGSISLNERPKKTLANTQDSSIQWYERTAVNDKKAISNEGECSSSTRRCTSSFGRRGSATPSTLSVKGHSRKPSYINQTSNWLNYSFNCILPSPDSCGDKSGVNVSDVAKCRLLYMDCSNSMMIAYFSNNADFQSESQFWNTGMSLEYSITYIAVYNLIEQTYIVVKLPVMNWLVLPSRNDKPIYLVSEKLLSLAAFTLPQEDFVAKILMYGSASVAEEVCHLNRWDQCSLPLNALETALELRQLDTVSFFLRNRDSQSENKNGEAPPTSRPPPPLPPDQLDAAVDLLTNSIRRNHDSEHNRQFAGQLLGMTLNFLLRLIKSQSITKKTSTEHQATSIRSRNNSESMDSSVELSLGQQIHGGVADGAGDGSHAPPNLNVTSYIQTLCQYIPKSSHTLYGGLNREEETDGKKDEGNREDEGFQNVLKRVAVKESWDNKSSRDVIRQALIKGNLPLAHAYLINKSTTTSSRDPHFQQDVTLGGVVGVGLGFVMDALSNRNYEQATTILTQMGANVRESLRFIFLHTTQRRLREFLTEQLSLNRWLMDHELNGLDFLRVLESYYPMEDYKRAESLYNQRSQRSGQKSTPSLQRSVSDQNDSLMNWMDEGSGSGPALTGNITDHYPEYFGGDQPVIVIGPVPAPSTEGNEQEISLYLQIPLYVVLGWSSVARQRILYEGILMSGRNSESSSKHLVQPLHRVEYHICHYDPMAVLSDHAHMDIVTVELINSLTSKNQCDGYIRDRFLDKLAKLVKTNNVKK